MYHKEQSISFKSSASALSNNLSVLEEGDRVSYATVHRSTVNVVTVGAEEGAPPVARQVVCKEPTGLPGQVTLLQVRWCVLPHRTVMVVTSHRGVQMFEADGSLLIFWHSLSLTKPSGETLSACFARGVCGAGECHVCVGTHLGHVLVFAVPAKGAGVTLADTLRQHAAPVSDVSARGDAMVSGDDEGDVIVWRLGGGGGGGAWSVTTRIPGFRSPVTALRLLRGESVVVCAYGSGHLRLYSAQQGALHCEVTAHARWITALDVAERARLVLSAGEDGVARVWKLQEGEIPELELAHSETVTDTQLCGAKFLDPRGARFCVTGYDVKEGLVYSQ